MFLLNLPSQPLDKSGSISPLSYLYCVCMCVCMSAGIWCMNVGVCVLMKNVKLPRLKYMYVCMEGVLVLQLFLLGMIRLPVRLQESTGHRSPLHTPYTHTQTFLTPITQSFVSLTTKSNTHCYSQDLRKTKAKRTRVATVSIATNPQPSP